MAKVSSPSSKMDDKMAKYDSTDTSGKDAVLTPTHSKTDSEHKVPESPSPKGQAGKKLLKPITRLSPTQLRE